VGFDPNDAEDVLGLQVSDLNFSWQDTHIVIFTFHPPPPTVVDEQQGGKTRMDERTVKVSEIWQRMRKMIEAASVVKDDRK